MRETAQPSEGSCEIIGVETYKCLEHYLARSKYYKALVVITELLTLVVPSGLLPSPDNAKVMITQRGSMQGTGTATLLPSLEKNPHSCQESGVSALGVLSWVSGLLQSLH